LKQTLRIIGGLYRGKKVHFPDIEGLRPTPDRVRETLFNWLMHDIRDAHCLDAFSGSGALGLEAFSRGAGRVVFLEHSPAACQHLQKTLDQFQSPALKLIKTDTQVYLQRCTEQFDLVFLDPPFGKNLIAPCLDFLLRQNVLKKNALVYLESETLIKLDPKLWQEMKIKRAGQVFYALIRSLQPTIS